MKQVLLVVSVLVLAAQVAAAGDPPTDSSAERRVRDLYGLVSVEPGGPLPDWAKIRGFFLDDAVIFMRTSREASSVMSVDGWVADFESFIEKSNVAERGFTERVVRLRATEFRNVAEVMVLYEAGLPTSTRPAQQGVDFFHLAKIDGEWRIVSIVNDIPESPEQIPESLRE